MRDGVDKTRVFAEFVTTLVDAGAVAPNPVTAAILSNLDDIHSVRDMADVAARPRSIRTCETARMGKGRPRTQLRAGSQGG